VRHLSCSLSVDFDTQQLDGRVKLDLEVAPHAEIVVLDTADLAIRSVMDADGRALDFRLGEPDPICGRSLSIERRDASAVVIEYATAPEAPALQWLSPDQTAGGALPFLYSQGHPLLTRSWLPTQDSPGIRFTFEAILRVPAELSAHMSAAAFNGAGQGKEQGRTFAFRQRHPIPAYLVALAVGDVAFRPLGPRSGVFAEPSVLDRAEHEFADLEAMLAAAEAIAGRYRWGRLDVLVMPPAFPFGGMENPCLMFVSPTILAGDRSLTSLLGHELAHAWSGNLVTCATWNDFWLNEGFTVYLELRIVEALYGRARAEMLEVYGRRQLAADLTRLGAFSPDTRLKIDLQGRSPLEGVTTVPYVKGAALLHAIEREVGRERFDRYLRSWFERRAFTSVTSEDFIEDVSRHLLADGSSAQSSVDFEQWVYQSGLPSDATSVSSRRLEEVDRRAVAFAKGGSAATLDAAGWTTEEWRHFLGSVPTALTPAQVADLDRTYQLTAVQNVEVLVPWLRVAIRHRYEPAMGALERVLMEQGRRKFLEPLYRDLMASDERSQMARRIYAQARPRYHATTRMTIDPIVAS
jgi:aminopeptidase N